MKLTEIKRDVAAIENGVWVGEKYGTPIPNMGDLCLKVRGNTNIDWRRLSNKLIMALPASRRVNLSIEDNDRITGECLKRACLIDWDGIEGRDGAPVKYSEDQAAAFIDDPAFAGIRGAILWAAELVAQQTADGTAADAKN